jgi:hypothetical protein
MSPSRNERGAVGTIVAALLALGVLLGFLALSVDVGTLMVERRQLQNGADAGALALADACARNPSACTSPATARTNIDPLVDANASDAAGHDVDGVCGRAAGGLPECAAGSAARLSQCPQLPSVLESNPAIPFVEVRTSSRSADGGFVRNVFARANPTGDPSSSATVRACARAAWGRPGQASATTPITISACEWQTYTSGGTLWVADPPVGAWPGYGGAGQPAYPPGATTPNTPGRELVISLHDPAKPPCSFRGKDTAGGFGYLDPTSTCSTTVTVVDGVNQWAQIDTGSSATTTCRDFLANVWANGPVLDIPVFDCIVRSTSGPPSGGIAGLPCTGAGAGGAQSYYHILGWAKFYLSGYKIGGGPSTERASRVSGSVPCSGANRCLSGWFVKGTLSQAATIVPPTPGVDLGVYAVVPAG